jgi:hypothetical protein
MTAPIDFETRELCPDDACIGVLDARGVCPECGKRAIRKSPLAASAAASAPASAPDLEEPIESESESASASDLEPVFDEERELCPDDACIGLIGPNGRCKECGRRRQS